jgi:putative solute:sodium symporter small subunit
VVEAGLGFLLIVAACVVLTGAHGALGLPIPDIFPLLGYAGTGLVLAAGVLLVADGFTRRAIARYPETSATLRTRRLTCAGLLATAVLALAVPLSANTFNLIHIEGFPAGYYLAAQGAVIGLVLLAFAWARRQNGIDAEQGGDSGGGAGRHE